MGNDKESSAINLIKILCIKVNEINNVKSWNFVKKKLLNMDKKKVLTMFLNKSIFEQVNALFTIITSFKDISPENLLTSIKRVFTIKPGYIEIYITKSNNSEATREGKIRYYINKNEFLVDIDPILNGASGYSFIYSLNTPLESKFQRLWTKDIIKPLELACMDLLLYVVNVTNSIIFPNMNNPYEYISD